METCVVTVTVTYYDSSGKVIGNGYTYTNSQDINSGAIAPFDLSSYPNKITHSKYELVVQGE